MSKVGERCLIQHLVDPDSLAVLADEGLPLEAIPTDDFRPVVEWALDYFHRGGTEHAPSADALRTRFGEDFFDDHEVDIEDMPDDTIEWAIEDLKSDYLLAVSQRFTREFAMDINDAVGEQRIAVVREAADVMVSLAMDMSRQSMQVDLREAITGRITAYEEREADRDNVRGMSLGFPEIDQFIGGVHPGELAVVGAPPKTGKSYLGAYTALKEWERGKRPVLFTLENSVEMTIDRIACMAEGVSASRWQHGEAHPVEVERVRKFAERVASEDTPLWVVQPEADRRTVDMMVREAILRGGNSLIIDQLTFVTAKDERAPRYLQIREMLHNLKEAISTARLRLPCLLFHQINRDGVKEADKIGHLMMHHFAEGSEVERTADFGFGLYQGLADRNVGLAKFQMLASRRTPFQHWELNWGIDQGNIDVIRTINIGE